MKPGKKFGGGRVSLRSRDGFVERGRSFDFAQDDRFFWQAFFPSGKLGMRKKLKLVFNVTGGVENANDLKRWLLTVVNHQIVTANRPEKDRFIGQVRPFMTQARVLRQQFASEVDVGFKLIRRRRIIRSDIGPDFLQVGQSLRRELAALHSGARLAVCRLLKAAISVLTRSAERARPARMESIPSLILPRTSFFQTSSR